MMTADSNAMEGQANDSELVPLGVCKGKSESVSLVDPSREEQCSNCRLCGRLYETYSFRFLFMGFAGQHLLKGFAMPFMEAATSFVLASYHVVGPRMQILGGIGALPFALKPIIGLISDCFPICGYNKAPYMIASSIVGVGACLVVALVPSSSISVESIVGCLFSSNLQMSTLDLLVEAKYAEQLRSKPESAPDLMTFVWFGLNSAALVASLSVGLVLKYFGTHAVFFIGAIPSAFVIIPLLLNYMDEVPQSSREATAARGRLLEEKEACFLCVIMFVGTMLLMWLGIMFESVYVNFVGAVVVAFILLVSFSLVLRPVIAKVNAFFVLQTSLNCTLGGATFYFMIDGPDKYSQGPHFSVEFLTTVLGTVGQVTALVGIMLYQRYMGDWKYRELLLMTTLMLSGMSVVDLLFFSRLNLRLGIPDYAFVFGSTVFESIVFQWMWLPGVVILSQLCPQGMEATMYALLAGCMNLGNTIASNVGALVLELVGCTPDGSANEDDKFENLWIASVVSIILPLLTVFLIPWLIPDAKQTERLLDDDDRSATGGSIWKQMVGE
eukprot:TRINITY_DN12674_c0_g2_i1.p1 TRINITY_DN12674_c0_g2~~TRINITY_DN12674_c0_g2_i1.p1  ORF type:complete len:555 (-),score=83.18 TRINITY_DN12674_c0_g2_i1:31-1695(-)